MGYHGRVRLWRVIALLLVLGVGAGPALLDPCLVGCHEPAAQAAIPSCHESAETSGVSGLSIAGTADCGHDHTGIEADSPIESRLTSARQAAPPIDVPDAGHSSPRLLPGFRLAPSSPLALRSLAPLHPPLRV